MSDLISRSKLIEEILEEANTKILDLESGITLGEMKEWVENQPAVESPTWIPCSERLPKCSGVYQITRKVVEGECAFFIADCAYFDGQDTWHNDNKVNHGRKYLKNVIAWQPLPEPYKGE